jgi:hypothetical protein
MPDNMLIKRDEQDIFIKSSLPERVTLLLVSYSKLLLQEEIYFHMSIMSSILFYPAQHAAIRRKKSIVRH